MIAFLAIAGLMALIAIGVVLWPLLRSASATSSRWPAVLAVAVLIPGLAFGLYQTWSNWSWSPVAEMPGVPPAVAQMVGRLEARLRANPNDINGWLLLGRSYFQLGEYLKAADAYERAYTQSGGENLEAILGLGETLVFAEGRAVTPRSAQLFERAFERAPNDPKALWYSGLAAFQSGRLDIARDRWRGLVALNPPPEVKRLLESKIAELDAQLGTPGSSAPAATANAPVVKVRVLLDPKLSDRVPQGAPLFVMVRAGEGGGPPLAVTRRDASQFPLLVELSDRDSMIAGRSLADAPSLTVVARIARSGDPRARSGDLEGKVGYDVKKHQPVDLLIDSIVP
jgi:cytochrome c-type biogenesis protein CcmH